MTDIHPIVPNDLLIFLSYLQKETWYFIGIIFLISIFYGIYVHMLKRYEQARHDIKTNIDYTNSLMERLETISENDPHFYEKLSLLLRSLLEESGYVHGATKKTVREISKSLSSREIEKILSLCTHYSYTNEKEDTREKREEIKEGVKRIVRSIKRELR